MDGAEHLRLPLKTATTLPGRSPQLRFMARSGKGEVNAAAHEAQRLFRKVDGSPTAPRHITDAIAVTRGLGLDAADEQLVQKAVDEPVADFGHRSSTQRLVHARGYLANVLKSMNQVAWGARDEIMKRSLSYWRWRSDVDDARSATQRFGIKKSMLIGGEPLVKGAKGGQAASHKYVRRMPDGQGGWLYDYGDGKLTTQPPPGGPEAAPRYGESKPSGSQADAQNAKNRAKGGGTQKQRRQDTRTSAANQGVGTAGKDIYHPKFKPTMEEHPTGDGHLIHFGEGVAAHVPANESVEHHVAQNAFHAGESAKFKETDPAKSEAHAHAANLHYKLGHALAQKQAAGGMPPQGTQVQSMGAAPGAPPPLSSAQGGGAPPGGAAPPAPHPQAAPPMAGGVPPQQQPQMGAPPMQGGMGAPPAPGGMGAPPPQGMPGQRPIARSADMKNNQMKQQQQAASMMPPPKPGKGGAMGAPPKPGMGGPPGAQGPAAGPQAPGGQQPPMGAPSPMQGAPGQQPPGAAPGGMGAPQEPSEHEPGVHSERTRFTEAHPDVRQMHDHLNRATKVMSDISAAHDHLGELKTRMKQTKGSSMPPRQKKRLMAQFEAEHAATKHDLVQLEDQHDQSMKVLKDFQMKLKGDRLKKNPFIQAFLSMMEKLGNFGDKVGKKLGVGTTIDQGKTASKESFDEVKNDVAGEKKAKMVKSEDWKRATRVGKRATEELRKSLAPRTFIAPMDLRRARLDPSRYDPMSVW